MARVMLPLLPRLLNSIRSRSGRWTGRQWESSSKKFYRITSPYGYSERSRAFSNRSVTSIDASAASGPSSSTTTFAARSEWLMKMASKSIPKRRCAGSRLLKADLVKVSSARQFGRLQRLSGRSLSTTASYGIGERHKLLDLISIAATVAFFLIAFAYVAGCERL